MSSIEARLRKPGAGSWSELMQIAADEIERLRTELAAAEARGAERVREECARLAECREVDGSWTWRDGPAIAAVFRGGGAIMIGRYECCRICGDYGWTDRHACAPQWDWRYFWTETEADDWIIGAIYARDNEDAATKAAELYDAEDYPLSQGGEVIIEVRQTGDQDVTRWSCRAESIPHYYVNEQAMPEDCMSSTTPQQTETDGEASCS